MFYFSGHGYANEFGGYVVTPDFGKYDAGVSMEHILQVANKSGCKNKVILLDCCFSGEMGSVPAIAENYGVIGNGVTILTACRHAREELVRLKEARNVMKMKGVM